MLYDGMHYELVKKVQESAQPQQLEDQQIDTSVKRSVKEVPKILKAKLEPILEVPESQIDTSVEMSFDNVDDISPKETLPEANHVAEGMMYFDRSKSVYRSTIKQNDTKSLK